ncbi:MAG: hypothetical protein LUQ11_15030 [Methylococcaceae bacterium]|nr:hypothetical protein [Methylococcaceae bacterium]
MNKYLAISVLMLMTGKAHAHSHPAVDALTHALEHAAMNVQTWLPYVLGLSLAALLGALVQVRRSRLGENRRRIK